MSLHRVLEQTCLEIVFLRKLRSEKGKREGVAQHVMLKDVTAL